MARKTKFEEFCERVLRLKYASGKFFEAKVARVLKDMGVQGWKIHPNGSQSFPDIQWRDKLIECKTSKIRNFIFGCTAPKRDAIYLFMSKKYGTTIKCGKEIIDSLNLLAIQALIKDLEFLNKHKFALTKKAPVKITASKVISMTAPKEWFEDGNRMPNFNVRHSTLHCNKCKFRDVPADIEPCVSCSKDSPNFTKVSQKTKRLYKVTSNIKVARTIKAMNKSY